MINENNNGWISVKDRLPEDGCHTLYYDEKSDKYGFCGYKNGEFYLLTSYRFDFYWRKATDGEVTHWFDVPKPSVREEFEKSKI